MSTVLNNPEESYMNYVEFVALIKQRIFECAAEQGLTGMQAMVLCLLNKPRQMSNLGKVFNCDPSNITGIVDGLEQKGLVERFEDPKDRRIKMVRLRDGGSSIRSTLLKQMFGPKSLLQSKLSSRETASFTKLINKITSGELAVI